MSQVSIVLVRRVEDNTPTEKLFNFRKQLASITLHVTSRLSPSSGLLVKHVVYRRGVLNYYLEKQVRTIMFKKNNTQIPVIIYVLYIYIYIHTYILSLIHI